MQSLVQKKPDTWRAVIYLNKVEDARARTEIIEQILAGSPATDDIPAYVEELQAQVGMGEQAAQQQIQEPTTPEAPEAPAEAGVAVAPQEAPDETIPVITAPTATTQDAGPVNRPDPEPATVSPAADVARVPLPPRAGRQRPGASPGEITLAHGDVLFLDELSEWSARTHETLRQSSEDRVITITPTAGTFFVPGQLLIESARRPFSSATYHG